MTVLHALLEGCETTFSRNEFGKIGMAWKQPKSNPIEILREIINNKVADIQQQGCRYTVQYKKLLKY